MPEAMKACGGVQGSQLAGGREESVRVEGAPLTLLEGVTDFLIHQRATLRKEAAADPGMSWLCVRACVRVRACALTLNPSHMVKECCGDVQSLMWLVCL